MVFPLVSMCRSLRQYMLPSLSNIRPCTNKSIFATTHRPCRHFSNSSDSTEGRLLIGFTCKQCNTRSHRTMSKLAYERGVVLAECSGCKRRHVIADHLGWFEQFGVEGGRTIEQFMEQRGELVRRSPDPAELSKLIEVLKEEEQGELSRGDQSQLPSQ